MRIWNTTWIDVYSPDGYSKGGINWATCGSRTVKETEKFIKDLKEAIKQYKKSLTTPAK